jgi:hypothetical protein
MQIPDTNGFCSWYFLRHKILENLAFCKAQSYNHNFVVELSHLFSTTGFYDHKIRWYQQNSKFKIKSFSLES